MKQTLIKILTIAAFSAAIFSQASAYCTGAAFGSDPGAYLACEQRRLQEQEEHVRDLRARSWENEQRLHRHWENYHRQQQYNEYLRRQPQCIYNQFLLAWEC